MNNEEQKKVPAADINQERPKKPIITKFRFWAFLFVLIPAVLLMTILVMVSMMFGEKVTFKLDPVTPEVLKTQFSLMQRISPQVSTDFPAAEATLVLTPKEVQHLLILGRQGHAMGVRPGDRIQPTAYRIRYENGKFLVDFSYTVKTHHMHIYAEVVPSISGDDIEIKPISFKVGRLPLPNNILTASAANEFEKWKQEPAYQLVRDLIVSAQVEPNGDIKIVYRPDKLAERFFGTDRQVKKRNAAVLRDLRAGKVTPGLLKAIASKEFNPKLLEALPELRFDKAILTTLPEGTLSPELYNALKDGYFVPKKLIPILEKQQKN